MQCCCCGNENHAVKCASFISNDFLINELSRKEISPMRKILSGCKSPLLKHIVSHRRQVFMTLNNKTEKFDYRFTVRVDEFDYLLFATSSLLKCFGCGEEGMAATAWQEEAMSERQGEQSEPGEHTEVEQDR